MNFPADLKYTTDHEWIRVEGDVGTIGVTDHAQGELGDVVYVDIPDSSATVAKGDTFGSIEAVKTVADLYAPVSGEIIEVNAVNAAPEAVNKEPYDGGWLVKIKLSDPSELDALLTVDAYKALIGA
ncbi:MAG: glycine cleavage system protein GcvH [Ignavibacteria bacterium]|nr:glycine cleavage system protein GcvH [Ignavibacteria bacterium]MBP7093932.1 glycine cleavage system protein GcvH [Candidatus Kapabacteria bacterium]MBK6761512.1 glycine cleavage system protein GcvH [Ignavibacteria bacterium]MBK7033535.1 glycine cleavage system protein GcvH [Ignavibacteria bacterium]MBK7186245.1 glycine cleavage system protein GcvH [Ignavibacteria bacterium]